MTYDRRGRAFSLSTNLQMAGKKAVSHERNPHRSGDELLHGVAVWGVR